jgi:hypothetical protein
MGLSGEWEMAKKIDIQRYNWIPRRTPMTITNVKTRTRCRKVKDFHPKI